MSSEPLGIQDNFQISSGKISNQRGTFRKRVGKITRLTIDVRFAMVAPFSVGGTTNGPVIVHAAALITAWSALTAGDSELVFIENIGSTAFAASRTLASERVRSRDCAYYRAITIGESA